MVSIERTTYYILLIRLSLTNNLLAAQLWYGRDAVSQLTMSGSLPSTSTTSTCTAAGATEEACDPNDSTACSSKSAKEACPSTFGLAPCCNAESKICSCKCTSTGGGTDSACSPTATQIKSTSGNGVTSAVVKHLLFAGADFGSCIPDTNTVVAISCDGGANLCVQVQQSGSFNVPDQRDSKNSSSGYTVYWTSSADANAGVPVLVGKLSPWEIERFRQLNATYLYSIMNETVIEDLAKILINK